MDRLDRAAAARAISRLDHQDLRAWHFVLTGGVLATLSPYGFEADPDQYQAVRGAIVEAKPDLVYVGLGFPKQERVIDALRPDLPFTWFLGCGAAVNFVAGDTSRAPRWMQAGGLEWAWRLACEPRRLAGRYLCRDAPYALRLLASAVFARRAT
jgi:N-acetylglucosaminyldiphosphoundecaprenol N-acetyl-beta-D-mannosaminyltransferase